jgi:hypothetical protein
VIVPSPARLGKWLGGALDAMFAVDLLAAPCYQLGVTVTRDDIVKAVVAALEPLDYVYAVWEGGAVAFDRVDRWSDIDICVDAEDCQVGECFPAVERALAALGRIALKFEMKQTMSAGYVQAFYRLEGTDECMLVDFAVFKHSWPDKLLEPEIHGRARFHFNKGGAVTVPRLDRRKLAADLRAALENTRMRLETFGCFVPKEIGRKNYVEAVTLYQRLVLDSLVDLLRIRYKPVRFGFKTRYIHYDLPPEVVERLRALFFVRDQRDLEAKYAEARAWFESELEVLGKTDFEARQL